MQPFGAQREVDEVIAATVGLECGAEGFGIALGQARKQRRDRTALSFRRDKQSIGKAHANIVPKWMCRVDDLNGTPLHCHAVCHVPVGSGGVAW